MVEKVEKKGPNTKGRKDLAKTVSVYGRKKPPS